MLYRHRSGQLPPVIAAGNRQGVFRPPSLRRLLNLACDLGGAGHRERSVAGETSQIAERRLRHSLNPSLALSLSLSLSLSLLAHMRGGNGLTQQRTTTSSSDHLCGVLEHLLSCCPACQPVQAATVESQTTNQLTLSPVDRERSISPVRNPANGS